MNFLFRILSRCLICTYLLDFIFAPYFFMYLMYPYLPSSFKLYYYFPFQSLFIKLDLDHLRCLHLMSLDTQTDLILVMIVIVISRISFLFCFLP